MRWLLMHSHLHGTRTIIIHVLFHLSVCCLALQKVVEDKTQAVIFAPVWPIQARWPILTNLIRGPCFLLPNPQRILKLEHNSDHKHPLSKMRLVVFAISGNLCDCRVYQNKQEHSFLNPEELAHKNGITHILTNGWITVKGRRIPLHQKLIDILAFFFFIQQRAGLLSHWYC